MANITSKLAFSGSVLIVLLMAFSAIPINAEETTNDVGEIRVVSGTNQEYPGVWTWDGTKCTLEIKGDVAVDLIDITLKDDACDGTIIIDGTVTMKKPSKININSTIHNLTITGGGKISSERCSIYVPTPKQTTSYANVVLTLDNISTDFADGYFHGIRNEIGNVVIKNCGSIKMTRSNPSVQSSEAYVIFAKGTITVENSNVYLKNLHRTLLMMAEGGISLPQTPSGSFVFVNPDGSADWKNGVTTEINGTSADCSLNIETKGGEPNNNLPLIIGVVVIVVLVAALLTYFLDYKKKNESQPPVQ